MLTPTQLANVRRIMKENRARRRAATMLAADRRDYNVMLARESFRDECAQNAATVANCKATVQS